MRRFKVTIQHGAYTYRTEVPAGDDEDTDAIKARAKAKMRRECGPGLSMCAETVEVEEQ